ncbi:MAG: helix-turn-helix domain-containing protein [Candidatus Aenigmarchaeota archaeon]|nr:helix-turn-helix domain-containing protein [Candidatus Aenigmarchaeota archaeon]
MDMDKTMAALKEHGLNDKEAKVYFTCLKSGSASVVAVSNTVRLPKSTCYDILNSLIVKGLVSVIIKNKTRFFEAADPRVLLDMLDEKKKLTEEIIPSLVSLKNSVVEKPKVTFYEGIGGIKSILSDVIETGEFVQILGNFSNFKKVTRHVAPQFIKKRVERQIMCECLLENSESSKSIKQKDTQELRETRITNRINKQNAECYLYGTKTAFIVMSRDEPVGLIIESKSINELQKTLFECLWNNC